MAIFAPGNLVIWLPGLLFVAALLYSARLSRRGEGSTATQWIPVALFAIALVIALLVPRVEMARAVSFANAHAAHAGAPVTRYSEIDYAAKDAYFRTALPPEERGDAISTGGDLFSFDDAPAATATPQVAASAATAADAEIEYEPAKGLAWMILVVLLLLGILYVLQDLKGFSAARR